MAISTMDLRDDIFRDLAGVRVTAVLTVEQDGVVAGIEQAAEAAEKLGLRVGILAGESTMVSAGQTLLSVEGSPKAVVMAEESIIGAIAKTSGIATAASAAARAADGSVEIVVGAWKKLPVEIRGLCRTAAALAGIRTRISHLPFVYLDKNYVRIFGGVGRALNAVRDLEGYIRVVQLRGEIAPIGLEAIEAAEAGADIVMVDTGRVADLREAVAALERIGLRGRIKVAFAGGVEIGHIPALKAAGADILDIGTAVVDAPMLGLKFDVVRVAYA